MGKSQPPETWAGFKKRERYNLLDLEAKVAYPIRDLRDLTDLAPKLDIPGGRKKK